MGRHLGIDLCSILVDFGTQVGTQNPHKIGLAGLACRHGVAWKA